MEHLNEKKVSMLSCGTDFVVALGETLNLAAVPAEDMIPLSQSVEVKSNRYTEKPEHRASKDRSRPERCSSMSTIGGASGRWSRH